MVFKFTSPIGGLESDPKTHCIAIHDALRVPDEEGQPSMLCYRFDTLIILLLCHCGISQSCLCSYSPFNQRALQGMIRRYTSDVAPLDTYKRTSFEKSPRGSSVFFPSTDLPRPPVVHFDILPDSLG